MKLQKRAQQGFTLIELMIVIAIVGILAAVALPAYQDYTIRAKMSEPLAVLGEAKTTISEYFITNGQMPTTNAQAGIRTAIDTDIVASLDFEAVTNIIEVSLRGGVVPGAPNDGDAIFQLSLTDTTSGAPEWKCRPKSGNALVAKYLPANCRG